MKRRSAVEEFAGVPSIVVGTPEAAGYAVVLLHGYGMNPGDLAPFAHSLNNTGLFVFPQAPLPIGNGRWAWWPVDAGQRDADIDNGPRDLVWQVPDGMETARQLLADIMADVGRRSGCRRIVLGGFSQGAMLACDHAILERPSLSGLVLMSSTRIAMAQWQARIASVRGLPVMISHGRRDGDLAFASGEALRDTLAEAGARVFWVPFDQGHEIPLLVWRELRKFLETLPVSN